MNYFIDFEANINNEIINMGCVDENGNTYSSLVKPTKKITPFIEKLTGITNDKLLDYLTADYVFSNFFEWIMNNDKKAQFYCYGDCDKDFVKKTLNGVTDLRAQMILSCILNNLHDFQTDVKKHFSLNQSISLLKLIQYYRNDGSITQKHSAIEDAYWLKEVFEHIKSEGEIDECPFPSYQKQENDNKPKVVNYNNSKKPKVLLTTPNAKIRFKNVGAASDWLIEKKINPNTPYDRDKICRRIVNAINQNKSYCGFKWERIEYDV